MIHVGIPAIAVIALLPLLAGAAQPAGDDYQPPVREQRERDRVRVLGPSNTTDFFELQPGDLWHGDLRVPLGNRLMLNLGDRVNIPPRSSENGTRYRATAAIESTDNVLAAPSDRRRATALLFGPGVNWAHSSARHTLQMDLSAEALQDASSFDHGSTLDAASFYMNGYYRLSETLALSAFDAYFFSQEPVAQSPVTVPGRFSAHTHLPSVGLDWQFGHRDDLSLRWTAADFRSARPQFVDTLRQDIDVHWRTRVGDLQRFGARVRYREVSFDGEPDRAVSALSATGDIRLSQRLLLRSALGVADGDGGSTFVGLASLTGVTAQGKWEIRAERDVVEIGGLYGLFALNNVSADTQMRIGESGQLSIGIQSLNYRPRETGDHVRLLRPRIGYTHSIDRHWTLLLRYLGNYDEVPAIGYDMLRNRLRATLMYVF
jgi:hypothetical protein